MILRCWSRRESNCVDEAGRRRTRTWRTEGYRSGGKFLADCRVHLVARRVASGRFQAVPVRSPLGLIVSFPQILFSDTHYPDEPDGKDQSQWCNTCVQLQKRRLLGFVLSNCTWKGGELTATYRQPFDLLAQNVLEFSQPKQSGDPETTISEIWLPRRDFKALLR